MQKQERDRHGTKKHPAVGHRVNDSRRDPAEQVHQQIDRRRRGDTGRRRPYHRFGVQPEIRAEPCRQRSAAARDEEAEGQQRGYAEGHDDHPRVLAVVHDPLLRVHENAVQPVEEAEQQAHAEEFPAHLRRAAPGQIDQQERREHHTDPDPRRDRKLHPAGEVIEHRQTDPARQKKEHDDGIRPHRRRAQQEQIVHRENEAVYGADHEGLPRKMERRPGAERDDDGDSGDGQPVQDGEHVGGAFRSAGIVDGEPACREGLAGIDPDGEKKKQKWKHNGKSNPFGESNQVQYTTPVGKKQENRTNPARLFRKTGIFPRR